MQQFECNDSGPDVNGGRKSNFERASSIRLSLRSSLDKAHNAHAKIGSRRQIPWRPSGHAEQVSRRVSKRNQPGPWKKLEPPPSSIYALKRFVGFSHTSKKITSLITFTNSSTLLHKAIRFENSLLLRNIWNLIFTISESKQNHQLLRWKIRFIDNLSTKFNRATRNEWSSIREWIDR